MRVDSHQHFWTLKRGDYDWLTPQEGVIYRDFVPNDLIPFLGRHKIDRTVLVQAAPTVAETRFLLELAHAHDFIAGVVGWVDMMDKSAPALIGELSADNKFLGIRPIIQDIKDPDWMLDDKLAPAFQAIIEENFTFDALVLPPHLDNLLILLKRYPDLRCVIDHGAKPKIEQGLIEDWSVAMGRLSQETKAYCKLSGLLTEAGGQRDFDHIKPYGDVILDAFGPKRVMWGSDWPVLTLADSYDAWLSMAEGLVSRLDEQSRQDIFGGTARRFYGF